ncbi:Protein kinase-like domain containing protein [Rhypophila sp. PSN 637]
MTEPGNPNSATTNDATSEYFDPDHADDASLGSQPPSRPTSPIRFDAEGLPIMLDCDRPLDTLLRHCVIKTTDGGVRGFWTLKVLRHILSCERVRAQLRRDLDAGDLKLENSTTIDHLVDAIHPHEISSPDDQSHYMRIYALLILCEESHRIPQFVERGESDMALPINLTLNQSWRSGVESRTLSNPLVSFNSMKETLKNYMYNEQRRMLTPYFDLDKDGHPRHRDLPAGTILPWWHEDSREMRPSEESTREGGYGYVSKVKMHPTSHGFRSVLQTIHLNNELFALKKLKVSATKDNQQTFRNELDNLKRFSGLVHDHLVTLLATFTLEGSYYFLFPCAECALDEYWEEKEPRPPFNLETVRWVSKQMSGIMAAVDTIHEPKHTHLEMLDEKRYGRHGDIKPDNILWFRSPTDVGGEDARGLLVISDMGLTLFNRDGSRSNISGQKIPGAPGYRPPECEVKGGKVSRTFDIWTLGCLFLELRTWLLGGWKLVKEFEEERTTPYITGSRSNVFFDLKEFDMAGGGTGNVAQVKEEVSKWFFKLHALPHCTQFVHDVPDKVEREMLIVLSHDPQTGRRTLSSPLRRDFQDMYRKCMSFHTDYAIKAAPQTRTLRRGVAVEAELNPVTKDTIRRYLGSRELPTYNGPRQPSMTVENLERMGELGATVSVRATYTEEHAITTYLANIFGYRLRQCTVIWRRGRYLCRIPRYLTAVSARISL